MSGKLYIHTGEFDSLRNEDFYPHLEILGNLTLTQEQMSDVGNRLRPWAFDRHVFTNDDNIFNGMRLAVSSGDLLPENIKIIFYTKITDKGYGHSKAITIDKNGRFPEWPVGFFDQVCNDLSKLIKN